MKEIINLGGDTDTNCAIVGGVIGIFYGVNNFKNDEKKELFENVINCNSNDSIIKRPLIYSPGFAILFIYSFYKLKELKGYKLEINDNYFPVTAAIISCFLTFENIEDIIFD